MDHAHTYTAFVGARRIAAGALADVLPALKAKWDVDKSTSFQVFEDATGRQVDFDLRGTLETVLERAGTSPARGPGRPKLGVVSREITLLPRHWAWLEEQPNGISAALRRLVDEARKSEPGKANAKRVRAALSRFMTAMAGDRTNYEEASRALFAGEQARFESMVKKWPKDIREYALLKSREALGQVPSSPAS